MASALTHFLLPPLKGRSDFLRSSVARLLRLFAASFALGVVCMAHAQIATTTAISVQTNPVPPGQPTALTATVSGAQVTYADALGIGASTGARLLYRFALSGGATFATQVVPANLVNVTNAASFTSVSIVQGGGVGQSWVLFQVTSGTPSIGTTQQFRLNFAFRNATPQSTVTFSVHDTFSSGLGDIPSNSALFYTGPAALLSSLPLPFTITGTVTFRLAGGIIAGCAGLPLSASSATCNAVFNTAGTYSLTADYSGDANYLASTGTLAGGMTILIDLSPFALPDATVGVPYSNSLSGVAGVAPYSFQLVSSSGNLPTGLSLDSTGLVSGTPVSAGALPFDVRVTDSAGRTIVRTVTLTVVKGSQTIGFSPPATAVVGTTIPIVLLSSAGLAIVYQVDTPTICTVDGTVLRLLATGSCVVTPIQSGDSNYFAAPSFPRTVIVTVLGGALPLRVRSAAGQSMVGTFANSVITFSNTTDPGATFRVVGVVDLDGNKAQDLVFQNTTQGEFGDVRVWPAFDLTSERLLRSVKLLWRVDAVGDLDGDGFGDLVWRFTGQTPNIDDTGVSYIWFTNGQTVTQVRKRGGAPLNWRLLGALDMNGDAADDMVYVSPTNDIRVLVATANRTCANFAAGSVPSGFAAVKLAAFSAFGRAEVLAHNATTGETVRIRLSATGANLPPPTANPDDPNASCTATSAVVQNTSTAWLTAAPTLTFFGTADFNGDGLADVVWLSPNRTVSLWLSQGSGQDYRVIENAGVVPEGFTAVQP
jgi:hypothetical protein